MCGYNITSYFCSCCCMDEAIICPFGWILTLIILLWFFMDPLGPRATCLALMAFSS